MKNFDWTSFTRTIAIKSTLVDLYDAWTVSENIEKWFLSKAKFYDETEKPLPTNTNVQQNGGYEFHWYLHDMYERGKITEANGVDYLQFTFGGQCYVDVRLREKNNYIIVQLSQHNIPTDDTSKENLRLGCHEKWSFFLYNLKSVYEGGLDLRNKDEEVRGMINE